MYDRYKMRLSDVRHIKKMKPKKQSIFKRIKAKIEKLLY